MRIDELKALRLRRSQLQAELARIEVLIGSIEVGEEYPDTRPIDEEEPAHPVPPKPKPHRDVANRRASNREKFYRDAENDFRNCDSNGNYCAHDPGDEDPKAWNNEEEA